MKMCKMNKGIDLSRQTIYRTGHLYMAPLVDEEIRMCVEVDNNLYMVNVVTGKRYNTLSSKTTTYYVDVTDKFCLKEVE